MPHPRVRHQKGERATDTRNEIRLSLGSKPRSHHASRTPVRHRRLSTCNCCQREWSSRQPRRPEAVVADSNRSARNSVQYGWALSEHREQPQPSPVPPPATPPRPGSHGYHGFLQAAGKPAWRQPARTRWQVSALIGGNDPAQRGCRLQNARPGQLPGLRAPRPQRMPKLGKRMPLSAHGMAQAAGALLRRPVQRERNAERRQVRPMRPPWPGRAGGPADQPLSQGRERSLLASRCKRAPLAPLARRD